MVGFKTPKFWEHRNILSALLLPASWIYAFGHKFHQNTPKTYHADIPVICVGNAVMGGSGKTPSVIALLALLKENGLAQNPYILTRGYGGSISEPIVVNPKEHKMREVGDEALLMSRYAPVIKSPDRAAGAKLAQTQGADMIIMDDGLLNTGLYQDIKILVVDSNYGFGNERLFPAGPLRAPLRRTLNAADILITIGNRTDGYSLFSLDEKTPTIWAYLNADKNLNKAQNYIAFAGIGLPQKFKRSLEHAGANILDFREFPDHHVFALSELEELKEQAQKMDAQLITTEKDFMRIPLAYRKYIDTFPVSLIFEEKEDLIATLTRALSNKSSEQDKDKDTA